MEKFTVHCGIAASLNKANIDTDAIIPAAHMRSVDSNMGEKLFANWRYRLDGSEEPDFVLNREPFRSSSIIVAGENFGCGSSREAAVYALVQFGIRCVIAPSFSDIFSENAFKNGLLTVTLAPELIADLHQHVARTNAPELTVDLVRCEVRRQDGRTHAFAISAAKREALLAGGDEIAETLRHDQAIARFQDSARQNYPWIYSFQPG